MTTKNPPRLSDAQAARLRIAITASADSGTRGIVTCNRAWAQTATIGSLEVQIAELLDCARDAVNVDAVFDEDGDFAGWVVTGRDHLGRRFDVSVFPD